MRSGASPVPGRASLAAAALLGLVLAALPLAWGGMREAGARWIEAGAALAMGGWVLALLVERRWPRPGLPVLAGVVLLALVGGWHVAVGQPGPRAFTVAHAALAEARWPHSMLAMDPLAVLRRLAAAAVVLLVAADLGRLRAARVAVAAGVVVGALGTGIVGLIQNHLGTVGIFGDGIRLPGAPFGPFFHHTSAGAALNLGLGIAVVVAGGELLARRMSIRLVLGMFATAVLVAAHLGHVGRMPPVAGGVAGMGLLAVAFASRWMLPGGRRPEGGGSRGDGLAVACVLGALVLAVGLVALGGRAGETAGRWRQLADRQDSAGPAREMPPEEAWAAMAGRRFDLIVPSDHRDVRFGDRGVAWAAGSRAWRERPFVGWGPGGWRAATSHHSDDPYVRTFYLYLQFAHQDVLQVLVEWGVVGAAGWGLLLLAGPARLLARRGLLLLDPDADEAGLLDLGILASLVAIALQGLGDFPLQIPAIQVSVFALAGLCHGAARRPA